jgi:hypothetical protein
MRLIPVETKRRSSSTISLNSIPLAFAKRVTATPAQILKTAGRPTFEVRAIPSLAVNDKVRILSAATPGATGTITKINVNTMAVVAMDQPAGTTRYVHLSYLVKIP